jgi:hypothetical protein
MTLDASYFIDNEKYVDLCGAVIESSIPVSWHALLAKLHRCIYNLTARRQS